LEILRI